MATRFVKVGKICTFDLLNGTHGEDSAAIEINYTPIKVLLQQAWTKARETCLSTGLNPQSLHSLSALLYQSYN